MGIGDGMKVALLGLGRMGRAMGVRLIDQNHQLVVWNRSPRKADELVKVGATEARTIADAVRSAEIVISFVANDDALRAVALGEGGVAAVLDSTSIYVDCSTVSPALSDEIAKAVGLDRFASVPVLGSPAAVQAGEASYLAGGPTSVLLRLEPLLTSLSPHIRRYPRASLATTAKVATNLMLLAGITTLAESIAAGRAGGLSDDQLRELLAESPMVAPGIRNRFEGVLVGGQEPWWTTELGAKDAQLAATLGNMADIDMPIADAVRRRLSEVANRGLDTADIAAVGELYRHG